MKNKRFIPALIAILAFGVFLATSLITKIYTDTDVPIQVTGAFLGAIVTAFITMILLHGQSQAEELKERNVKVFEEKTERYKVFIDKLWGIWKDRKITLEEISQLLESVIEDILLFTSKDTTDQLLKKLDKITETTTEEKKNTEEIQKYVFEIINLLSKEMNLGGQIDNDQQDTLKKIDNKVRLLLELKVKRKQFLENKKKYLELFLEDFNKAIGDKFGNKAKYIEYKNGCEIRIKIRKSNVELLVDPGLLAFYVEFWGNRSYQKAGYRARERGWAKQYLKGWEKSKMTNFEDPKSLNNLIQAYDDSDVNNPAKELADEVSNYYDKWKHNDKGIEDVIKECEPNSL